MAKEGARGPTTMAPEIFTKCLCGTDLPDEVDNTYECVKCGIPVTSLPNFWANGCFPNTCETRSEGTPLERPLSSYGQAWEKLSSAKPPSFHAAKTGNLSFGIIDGKFKVIKRAFCGADRLRKIPMKRTIGEVCLYVAENFFLPPLPHLKPHEYTGKQGVGTPVPVAPETTMDMMRAKQKEHHVQWHRLCLYGQSDLDAVEIVSRFNDMKDKKRAEGDMNWGTDGSSSSNDGGNDDDSSRSNGGNDDGSSRNNDEGSRSNSGAAVPETVEAAVAAGYKYFIVPAAEYMQMKDNMQAIAASLDAIEEQLMGINTKMDVVIPAKEKYRWIEADASPKTARAQKARRKLMLGIRGDSDESDMEVVEDVGDGDGTGNQGKVAEGVLGTAEKSKEDILKSPPPAFRTRGFAKKKKLVMTC